MRNLVLFIAFLFLCLFIGSCNKKVNKKVRKGEFTTLTVNKLNKLHRRGLLPQISLHLSDSLVAVKEGARELVVTIDDGTAQKSYYSSEDSLIVTPFTEVFLLSLFTDPKSKSLVLLIGLKDSINLDAYEFLVFWPNSKGEYVLRSETQKINGVEKTFMFYGEEKFLLLKEDVIKLFLKKKKSSKKRYKKALTEVRAFYFIFLFRYSYFFEFPFKF